MEQLLKTAKEAARSAGRTLLELRRSIKVRQKAPRDLVTEADMESQRVIRERIRLEFPDHDFLGEESGEQENDSPPIGSSESRSESGFVWVVDPLDGTTNYIHGFPFYSVSIALTQYGTPIVGVIYDPVRDQMFSATKAGGAFENGVRIAVSRTQAPNASLVATSFAASIELTSPDVRGFLTALPQTRAVRRLGSTALDLAYVATGQLDAYWSWSCKIWDIAAGVLLVQEAGGTVTGWDGSPPILFQDSRILAAATPQLHASLKRLLTEHSMA